MTAETHYAQLLSKMLKLQNLMKEMKYLCGCIQVYTHTGMHSYSQFTSRMARTDLARSLASAARVVVTVGPILPSRARRALEDSGVLLPLKEGEKKHLFVR